LLISVHSLLLKQAVVLFYFRTPTGLSILSLLLRLDVLKLCSALCCVFILSPDVKLQLAIISRFSGLQVELHSKLNPQVVWKNAV
jgi:hypothetical protein